VICAVVTWFVFLRIQTARADAGEEIGRIAAPVPAT
jgi:NNP family nitrate/nitrite transporter-like MFS transporter